MVFAPLYEVITELNWSVAEILLMLKEVPEVCVVTLPLLPLPVVKVWPGNVITNLFKVPMTCESEPRFVFPFVSPAIFPEGVTVGVIFALQGKQPPLVALT